MGDEGHLSTEPQDLLEHLPEDLFATFRAAILGVFVGLCLPPISASGQTAQGRAAQEPGTQPRLALVIGEGAYPEGRLPTAVEDAGLMASAFAQAGFSVTALADADAATLRRTIAEFADKARAAGPAAVLAVYVSGDGLQYDGENWLVPVGARIERDGDVPAAALKLSEITAPMQAAAASTRLFVFDLARQSPFATGNATLANGLSLTDAPSGSVYAYNAAPGAVAPPAIPPYGAYARALAEAMQTPGLSVADLLRRVRLRVGERTDGAVVPFDDGTAAPGFAFLPGTAAPAAPLPDLPGLPVETAYSVTVARDTLPAYAAFVAAFPREPLTGRIRAMAAVRREALFWSEAVRANTPRAYWTLMRRYPRGPHLGDARRMLFALHAALEPPPRFDIVGFEGLAPPPAEELALLDHPGLTFADADGPSIPAAPSSLLPPPRAAFYEALPPAPIAPAQALPLPLLPVLAAPAPAAGSVEEPAVPGGRLVTTFAPTALATARAGATVSRVNETVKDRQRTILEAAADGRTISRTIVAAGTDGALTVTLSGPGEKTLGRAVSRDAAAGLRETTLSGPDGQTVATMLVTADGIVKSGGLLPGAALPPRFVLAPNPDPKNGPVVLPEVVARPAPPAVESAAPVEASAAEAGAKPPPPPTPGLTGEPPKLDLPPAPKAAPFDSAAAPVAEAPAPATTPSATTSGGTPSVTSGATAAPVAPPPVTGPPPGAEPAPPSGAGSGKLPSEPPLPPHRAAPKPEQKPRRRVGR